VLEARVLDPKRLAYTLSKAPLYIGAMVSNYSPTESLRFSSTLYCVPFFRSVVSQALAPFFEVNTRCLDCWHDPRPRAAPKRRARRPSPFVCTMSLQGADKDLY
jgi:hypothetical protein